MAVLALTFAFALAADFSGMLHLTNGLANAHGCPVSANRALTNRHIAKAGSNWIWGVGDGEAIHGLADVLIIDLYRDLALIAAASEQKFPQWYGLATDAPKAEDHLWLTQYSWSNSKKAYGSEILKIRVTRVFNGQVIFVPAGKPGSSGGCILNALGEIVAINSAGHSTEDKDEVGIGVAVWGNWLDLLPTASSVKE